MRVRLMNTESHAEPEDLPPNQHVCSDSVLKVKRTAPSLKSQSTQNPKADCKAHTFFPGCLGRWHFPRALPCT